MVMAEIGMVTVPRGIRDVGSGDSGGSAGGPDTSAVAVMTPLVMLLLVEVVVVGSGQQCVIRTNIAREGLGKPTIYQRRNFPQSPVFLVSV